MARKPKVGDRVRPRATSLATVTYGYVREIYQGPRGTQYLVYWPELGMPGGGWMDYDLEVF